MNPEIISTGSVGVAVIVTLIVFFLWMKVTLNGDLAYLGEFDKDSALARIMREGI